MNVEKINMSTKNFFLIQSTVNAWFIGNQDRSGQFLPTKLVWNKEVPLGDKNLYENIRAIVLLSDYTSLYAWESIRPISLTL